MNTLTKLLAVSIIVMASMSANAEFVKGDWEIAGDASSLTDTDTGIEWLFFLSELQSKVFDP